MWLTQKGTIGNETGELGEGEPRERVTVDVEVLVAEHDVGALSMIDESLTRAGFRCVGVTTAHAALTIAQQQTAIDAIVADLELPDANGMELVRRFHDVYADRSPPRVLLLTAHPSLPVATEALRLGVHDLLTKPVQPRELVPAVRSAITRSREARRVERTLPAETESLLRKAQEFLSGLLSVASSLDLPSRSERRRARMSAFVLDLMARAQQLKIEVGGPGLDGLAWDILTELMRAEYRKQQLAVSDFMVRATGASSTTALRRVNELVQEGYVTKRPDMKDARRDFVSLTPKGRALVKAFIQRAKEQLHAPSMPGE